MGLLAYLRIELGEWFGEQRSTPSVDISRTVA
jgi:hypothetical protein